MRKGSQRYNSPIKASLDSRRSLRRNRRHRKTRYREARFLNRTKPKGWLAPSLRHRVLTIQTWFSRLRRFAPIETISQELVRFDMQQMQNPEISGIEYQQGKLAGYEVREYLLEKWNRTCAYCGAKDTPLQIEHIQPRARGGSDCISNLALACEPCNAKKGTQDVKVFLAHDPERLAKILAQAKAPVKDADAVNMTRWALFQMFTSSGLPVEVGTGSRTKFNRVTQGLPKAHWIDAACVGESGANTILPTGLKPLFVRAFGHGFRRMCQTDKYGFPKLHRTHIKKHFGFETGDIVRAAVPRGKYKGVHVGRVIIRTRPSFDVQTEAGKINSHARYLTAVHRRDGYMYL